MVGSMTPPSICFVCGNIYPLLANLADRPVVGGAEVQQLLIGLGLRDLGFKVSYVTEEYGQGVQSSARGFPVFSFRLGRNKLIQAFTLIRALWLAGADVYYVRDTPKYGFLIYLFCRLTGRKIVQALASDVEVRAVKGDDRPSGLAFRVHAAWRRRADLVIAQTTYQAEQLRARWGVTAQVVPSIVPVPASPPGRNHSGDCFRVLWVARIHPVKRIEWLIDIARSLPGFQFVVIGGSGVNAQAYAETIRPQLAACPNLRWLGHVPNNQVNDYFQNAEVLLHTSGPGSEGFPHVFLQAWAASIPVVSTGSDPDGLLTTGGLGVLTATVEEAVAALQQWAADPAGRQAVGGRGYDYVWKNFRPEVVLPRLADLLRGLVPAS
jgi:glycosyltransferase involved in cell wall biosynthesis